MNTETRAPARAARKEGALTRWIVPVFVVALLLLGGYKGALWLQANRDTVLPALRQSPFTQAGAPPSAPAASGLVNAPPAPPATRRPGDEPPAPAVLGGTDMHPCLINGKTTYTNRPCPEGAALPDATLPAPAEGERASGADDGQAARDAECGYLAAETARLAHEFDQPLPPPVLDQIAGRLKALRERGARLQCAGETAAPAASAPARARSRPPA